MKNLLIALTLALLPILAPAKTGEPQYWPIVSPDHEQTFAYGMETSRVWRQWGRDNHLAVLLSYTNDPFVDWNNPRQYDNFRFAFPNIKLGPDGETFYYHAPNGTLAPVAKKRKDFFGVTEVKLLPNAELKIYKPHGYITLVLIVENQRQSN